MHRRFPAPRPRPTLASRLSPGMPSRRRSTPPSELSCLGRLVSRPRELHSRVRPPIPLQLIWDRPHPRPKRMLPRPIELKRSPLLARALLLPPWWHVAGALRHCPAPSRRRRRSLRRPDRSPIRFQRTPPHPLTPSRRRAHCRRASRRRAHRCLCCRPARSHCLATRDRSLANTGLLVHPDRTLRPYQTATPTQWGRFLGDPRRNLNVPARFPMHRRIRQSRRARPRPAPRVPQCRAPRTSRRTSTLDSLPFRS